MPPYVAGASHRPAYAALLLAVLLAGVAVAADPAGRVLAGLGALAVVAVAVRDLVLSPPLTADAHGLTLVSGTSRLHAAWRDVERVRVVVDRRARVLELDLGDAGVHVLGRLRLQDDPQRVLVELQSRRHAADLS